MRALPVGAPPASPRDAILWTFVPIYGHLFKMPAIVLDVFDAQAGAGLGGRRAVVESWRRLWVAQWAVGVASRLLPEMIGVYAANASIMLAMAAALMAILVIQIITSQQQRLVPQAVPSPGRE